MQNLGMTDEQLVQFRLEVLKLAIDVMREPWIVGDVVAAAAEFETFLLAARRMPGDAP